METTEWTIPDLLQLSGGYWSTCALHAAVKLELFGVLDGIARSAPEVAQLRQTDPRATGMLLDALSALGLLEKRHDTYIATPFCRTVSFQNVSRLSGAYYHAPPPSYAGVGKAG